jgi:hypothetical protein
MREIVTSEPRAAALKLYDAIPCILLCFFLYRWKQQDKSKNEAGTFSNIGAGVVVMFLLFGSTTWQKTPVQFFMFIEPQG